MSIPQNYLRAMHRPPALRQLTYDNQANTQLPDTEPQRDQAPALGTTAAGEKEGVAGIEGRHRVRITGYRVRPLDPDNFAASVKDCLDGLRHGHLIPGDEPWRIILETDQIKVRTYKDEKTEISITYPEP